MMMGLWKSTYMLKCYALNKLKSFNHHDHVNHYHDNTGNNHDNGDSIRLIHVIHVTMHPALILVNKKYCTKQNFTGLLALYI